MAGSAQNVESNLPRQEVRFFVPVKPKDIMKKKPSFRSSSRTVRFILQPLIVGLAALPAAAATGDWNIDVNTSGWGTPSNWLGGTVPDAVGDTANFLFNISAARTINLDGSRTVGTLNIGDTTAALFGYTLNANGQGGQLIFDATSGNAQLTFTAAGNAGNTLNVPLVLNDTLEIHALNSAAQTFNGNISGAGSLVIDSGGTHPAGTASSVGQVTLTGYNTFSGLALNQARLQIGSTYALGTGPVNIGDGGNLYLTNAGHYFNSFTLNGLGWNEPTHGQLGALRSDTNAVLTGTITLAGADNRIASNGGTTLLNGAIGQSVTGANLDVGRWVPPSGAGMAGTYVINNTATATGVLSISSGTLRVGDFNTQGDISSFSSIAFGKTNTNAEAAGAATLEFRRNDNVTITKAITETVNGAGNRVVGSLVHSGAGVLTLNNGAAGYTGNTTVNGISVAGAPGRIVFGSGGAYVFGNAGVSTGTMAMSNGADIEFRTSSNVTINGNVTGSDTNPGLQTFLTWNGSGTLTLGGAGNNAGNQVLVQQGTVELAKTAAGVYAFGGSNQIGAWINGGTLRIANGVATDQIWANSDIKLDSGTLDLNGRNDGFDVLTGNGGTVTNSGATASVLTLGENNSTVHFFNGAAYAASFGGALQDGVSTLGLTKTGSGLQTLTGASSYTGATSINGGVLAVNGSLAAGGTVAVNSTGILSGTGSVGAVTMAGGGGIRPGASHFDTATGTLSAASLTVNGGDLRFNLGTANDLVTVAGAANFTAASTVTPVFTAAPSPGLIPLVNAAGGLTVGTAPTLTLPATTRSTFTLTPSANSLGLTVSGPAAKNLTWSDANFTGAWNLNTTANFTDGGVTETFYNLDAVTFPDVPHVAKNIALAAGLSPSAVTVNAGTGNDYTFSTGSLAGGMNLTKTGAGMLTVNTANTFSGNVNVNAGTLRAGNGAALGDANGWTTVASGATLDINAQNLGAEVVRIAGTGVGGAGALVNNSLNAQTQALRFLTLTDDATIGGIARFDIRRTGGANVGETLDLAGKTLTKIGNNLFYIVGSHITDGNINVQGGQVGFAFADLLAQGSGTITFNPGTRGNFYQTAGPNFTRNIVANGATFDTEGQNSAVNSNILLTGDLGFVNTGNTLTLNGTLSESGGARSLTKLNGGAVTLNGNNTFTGGLAVGSLLTGGGTLNLQGTNTVSGAVTVNNGTLQVLSTLQQPATLGTPSSIALSPGGFLGQGGSILRLNLASSYTLPTTTLSDVTANVINFNGLYQDTTLTINQPLGTTEIFNTLNIEQGTAVFGSSANVRLNQINVGLNSLGAGNVGTLNIQPGATVNVRTFYLGEGANGRTGFVNQTGGTVNVTGQDTGGDGSFQIGRWNGSGAAYNLSGGVLNVPAATTSIGIDGTNASLNVSGAAVANFWKLQVDGRGATGPIGGTLNLSGGEVNIGDGGLSNFGGGQINLSGGTLGASSNSTWSSGMNLVNNSPVIDTRSNTVTISGSLYGPGGFTKTGSGVAILSGAASNLAGTVNANAGTLYVLGAMTSPQTVVNVNSGAILALDGAGGGGAIAGTVNVNSGGIFGGNGNGSTTGRVGSLNVLTGGDLRPGLSAGTLSAGAANISGGTLRFELDGTNTATGGGVNDLVAVTNGLTFTGGQVRPSFNSAPVSGNTYTLFTSGALTGLPAIEPAAANSRLTYTLAPAGNNVTLNVTGTTKALTWTGASTMDWDVNSTANWTDGGAEKFFQMDSVTFDGAAAGTVTLAGSIQPQSTLVTGASDYAFTGGSIDTGTLTKSGAGKLTLLSPNSYTGGTSITGGTLSFTNGSLGTQGGITVAGGALQWNGHGTDVSQRLVMTAGSTATLDTNGNNVIAAFALGNGTTSGLTKEGAGTLTLLNTATYTGATSVNAGTLQIGNNGTIGALNAASPVTIGASGKVQLYRSGLSIPFNNPVSGSGTLEFKGDGTFQNADYVIGGNNTGFNGSVVINKARVQADNQNDFGSAAITIQDGGQILATAGTYTNALSMTGNGWWEGTSPFYLGALRMGGGATWNGAVTLAGTSRIHTHGGGDAGTINGTIGGPGSLHKTGQGTLTIGGATANTHGTTIVDSGTLIAAKTAGTVALPGNIVMGGFNTNQPNLRMGANGQIAPTATITFANYFNNWTRLDLQGTSQTIAGLQGTLGGGVLQNERLGGGGTTAPGTLTIANSADFTYDGYIRDRDGGTSLTIPLNLVKEGAGTQTITWSAARNNAQVSYTGTTTVNQGTLKLVNLAAGAGGGGGANYASPTTVNAGGTLELNSTMPFASRWTMAPTANLAGAGTVNKTGSGFAYVSGAVTMSGTINVLEGTFGSDGNNANWSGSTVNVNVSAGATLDSRADPMTINSLNGAGTVTNSFGNGANVFDNFTVGVADGSGVFTGSITDGGTGSGEQRGGLNFVKAGSGTQTIAGTNTYTGTTTISGGTLRVGNGGTTGNLGAGNVINNAALVVDRAGTLVTHNPISGSGTLSKEGSGTLVLTGNSTYAGATTISSGTVKLGAAASLPVGGATVWLDATDGATINTGGGGVTSWTNKGALGAAGDATAALGQEPIFISGEPAMNNNPVIRFDAQTPNGVAPFDRLTTGSGTDYTAGNATVIYIGRMTGGANQRLLAGTGNNWLLGTWGDAANTGGGNERAFFGTNWVAQGTGWDTNSRVYTGTFSENGEAAFFVNGVSRGTATGMQGPAGLSLGGGYNAAPTTEFSDGDIGELLVFPGVLSAEDRRAVEAYLSRKWQNGNTNILPATTALSLAVSGTTLDVNGVIQTVGSTSGVAGSSITLGGGALTTGGDNTTTVFAGDITGMGNVTKTGSGLWNLSGSNNIGGVVTAAGGTLSITGTTVLGSLNVDATATLAGNGTIQSSGGNITLAAGSTLAPGTSPGTLVVNLGGGTFDLSAATNPAASAAMIFELGNPGSDGVLLTNTFLNIGSGLEFDDFVFTAASGFAPGVYTLFDGDSTVTGSLGSNLTGIVGGYSSALGLADNNKDLVLTVIPEPGTSALAASALLLLARRRRR